MKEYVWKHISTPSKKVIASYDRQFNGEEITHIQRDVMFFSGFEEVNEERVLKSIMSGWIEDPVITNLCWVMKKR